MAQIAIIGTKGAGKTVFLSVLAMRYRHPVAGRPWLEWKNRETQLYVSEAWDTLARQDWPASTQSNKDRIFPLLEWALHAGPDQSHPLRVIDSIGQDIKTVFESKPSEWNKAQSKVREEFDRADVVLFLVNLREVIDAASQGKIDEIEIPIKLAVESAAQRGACFALLLSQHDSFADYLARAGIGGNDPLDALRHFLPQLAGFLGTVRDDRVRAFYIAAVAETIPTANENGTMEPRPKHNFKSEGLDAVLSWTVGVLPKIQDDLTEKNRQLNGRIRNLQSELAPLEPQINQLAMVKPPTAQSGGGPWNLALSLFAAVLAFFLARSFFADDVPSKHWETPGKGGVFVDDPPVQHDLPGYTIPANWTGIVAGIIIFFVVSWIIEAIRKADHEEQANAYENAMRALAGLKNRQATINAEIAMIHAERQRLH